MEKQDASQQMEPGHSNSTGKSVCGARVSPSAAAVAAAAPWTAVDPAPSCHDPRKRPLHGAHPETAAGATAADKPKVFEPADPQQEAQGHGGHGGQGGLALGLLQSPQARRPKRTRN